MQLKALIKCSYYCIDEKLGFLLAFYPGYYGWNGLLAVEYSVKASVMDRHGHNAAPHDTQASSGTSKQLESSDARRDA